MRFSSSVMLPAIVETDLHEPHCTLFMIDRNF